MTRRPKPMLQIDLFLWDQLEDARREVERAEAARHTARLKHKRAPHGMRADRYAVFLRATEDALKASRELARLQREVGQ